MKITKAMSLVKTLNKVNNIKDACVVKHDELDDADIDDLIAEEYEAIADYEAALTQCENATAKERLTHILEEEKEHVRELEELKAKQEPITDGVSPMTYAKLKEKGYSHKDWEKWSDEEKVKHSQEGGESGKKEGSKKEESSKETPKKEETKKESKFARRINNAIERGSFPNSGVYSNMYRMKASKSEFEELKSELKRLGYNDVRYESNPYVRENVFFKKEAPKEEASQGEKEEVFMEENPRDEHDVDESKIVSHIKKLLPSDIKLDEVYRYSVRHDEYSARFNFHLNRKLSEKEQQELIRSLPKNFEVEFGTWFEREVYVHYDNKLMKSDKKEDSIHDSSKWIIVNHNRGSSVVTNNGGLSGDKHNARRFSSKEEATRFANELVSKAEENNEQVGHYEVIEDKEYAEA